MVEPLQTITAILLVSNWSSLLLRIVLQDALGEVMKVCPPMKLKVFVDDIKAFLEGRDKELPGIGEKVLRAMRMEVEEKGLELSITEGGEEGQSKVIASCSYLTETFSGKQQKRRRRPCTPCADTGSGPENVLEVEEELSTMAMLFWAAGVWMGRWKREQEWRRGGSRFSKCIRGNR